MKWPWTINNYHTSDRPTVTFLDEGRMVIGLPTGMRPDEVHSLVERLRAYRAESTDILLFPFPVDVVDLRTKAPAKG